MFCKYAILQIWNILNLNCSLISSTHAYTASSCVNDIYDETRKRFLTKMSGPDGDLS